MQYNIVVVIANNGIKKFLPLFYQATLKEYIFIFMFHLCGPIQCDFPRFIIGWLGVYICYAPPL